VRIRLALATLLLAGLAGVAVWVGTTPSLRVRQVRVQGTSDMALVAAVQALPLTGCFVALCDTSRATARVETLPQVARARTWLAPPSTLVVQITPRVPVLIWRAGSAALLVGADGVIVGPEAAKDLSRLPLVDDPASAALPGGKSAPGTVLPTPLVELAEQLRSSPAPLLGGTVSLSYDASLGLVADDGNGLRIVFGDPTHAPAGVAPSAASQLAALGAILQTLAQAGEHATLIDLRWGSYPVYRLG
jgi:hypothetical protein